MSRSVMVVENENFASWIEKENPGYSCNSCSKGHELARESLDYGDAEKFSSYDIILIEANNVKAEELRIMMQKATNRDDIIIARYIFKSFWETSTGYYQVVKINESFMESERLSGDCPWRLAFAKAKEILEESIMKRSLTDPNKK